MKNWPTIGLLLNMKIVLSHYEDPFDNMTGDLLKINNEMFNESSKEYILDVIYMYTMEYIKFVQIN